MKKKSIYKNMNFKKINLLTISMGLIMLEGNALSKNTFGKSSGRIASLSTKINKSTKLRRKSKRFRKKSSKNFFLINPASLSGNGISSVSYEKELSKDFQVSISAQHLKYRLKNETILEDGQGAGVLANIKYYPFSRNKWISGLYSQLGLGVMKIGWSQQETSSFNLTPIEKKEEGNYTTVSAGIGVTNTFKYGIVIEPKVDFYTFTPQKSDSKKNVTRLEPSIAIGLKF